MPALSFKRREIFVMKYRRTSKLNNTEKLIYHYVVDHADQMDDVCIRNVANGAYTSTASVVRFYHKLGVENFNKFKKEIHLLYDGNYLIEETDAEMEYHHNRGYYHSRDFELRMRQAVSMIYGSTNIDFIGVGNSGALAAYGARYFSNAGFFAHAITDGDYPPRLQLGSNYILIVISESGETSCLSHQIDMCKDYQASVILITNGTKPTKLQEKADLVLPYKMTQVWLPQNYNLTSALPVVYIIERLAKELFQKNHRMIRYTGAIE